MIDSSTSLRPVAAAERILALDVLRGFALLGILVMNIQSYSMPSAAYFFPVAYGDLEGVNYWIWYLGDIFANRKFMGLFSLLFGAGIVLMDEKAAAAGRGCWELQFRRMGVLWIIGMIHAYLFWDGDILVPYAVCGLLLYFFRKARPSRLLVTALIFLAVGSILFFVSGLSASYWSTESVTEFREQWQPTAEKLSEEIAVMRGSWGNEIAHRAPDILMIHLSFFPFHVLWRAGGFMFLGMALYKWRVLSGERSRRLYAVLLGLGLLLGLPLSVLGAWSAIDADWEPIHSFFLASQFGYWGALPLVMGYLAAVMLVLRGGALTRFNRRLAAVGRMAFSNYLLQTLVCTTLFYGRGFGLFGQVERGGQALLVLGIWIIQLSLSPLWLRHFHFGPAEWLWRSLSYGKRQPFRNRGTA